MYMCPHCKEPVKIAGMWERSDVGYEGKTVWPKYVCHACGQVFTTKQLYKEQPNELMNNTIVID